MRSTLVSILFVVACSDGDPAVTPDAKPVDIDAPAASTSCANPIPTTATPTVVVSGSLADGSFDGSANPLAGATLDAFRLGGASLGTATSEVSGAYQLTATTAGLAFDYLQLDETGYLQTRYFPRAPFSKATSVAKFPMFTTADFAQLPTPFSVTQDPTKGVVIVIVRDCQSSPVANSVVTISPAGSATVEYPTGTTTDSTGLAYIFNVTAGTSTINAMVGATAYHEHAVTADPAYLTLATVSEQ